MDFRTTQSPRLDGVADSDVLIGAALDSRILVSHDFDTMPRHFQDFTHWRDSPGLLLIPQHLPVGRAVECLILAWQASEPEEWKNRVCLIPSMSVIFFRAR